MFFSPILSFRVLDPFWERVGVNHNKCSSSLHLWEGIMMFWTIFRENTIVKVKNGGNNGGNMKYDYGLHHKEIGEQCFVLTCIKPFLMLPFVCAQ